MTRYLWWVVFAAILFALAAGPRLASAGGADEAEEEAVVAEAETVADDEEEPAAEEEDEAAERRSQPRTSDAKERADDASAPSIGLFDAMEQGAVEVKFIARSDRDARVLITNHSKRPVNLQLPEAFAGVPVLAQFGGGGGGRAGGGGGGRAGGGGGGGQQAVGGGLGGGGGGGLGGGGGGGVFSVPPEHTSRINVAVVCLDHGLRDPSSSKPYKIVPAESHVESRAMVELLKAFGRGELHHGAAQAATWHLNSNVSWEELAAKRQGTRRSPSRPPYFSQDELHTGLAYAHEAHRLAEEAELMEQLEASDDTTDDEADEDTSRERSETDWMTE